MRNFLLLIVSLLFCQVATLPCYCQEMTAEEHAHMGGAVGYVPRDVLQQPITLRHNIGPENDPLTTKNAEAQAFYNQGMAYIHSYVWVNAARSFNQALRLDPALALAHVGLFRVFINLDDLAAAADEIKLAQSLQAPISDREKRRIDVSVAHLAAMQDLRDATKHAAYKKAIETALDKNPEDVELWLLRGNAEEAAADGRGQGGHTGSIAFYEAALARSPDNFAAHHYLIHSYEVIGRNDLAEKQGERYAQLADGVPHAHHMWGHDLRLVGRIDDAIREFQTADQLERLWYKNDGMDPSLDWHRPHNLDLLSRSLQYEGRMRDAETYIREAMQLQPTTMYAGYGKKALPDFLIARGRYQAALDAATPMEQSKWPLGRLGGHLVKARALLAMNKVSDARGELAAAEKEIPDCKAQFKGVVTFERIAGDQVNEVKGELLVRSPDSTDADTTKGEDLLRQAADSLASHRGADALAELYLLEHIGRVARERGRWVLAGHVADLMTAFDANYFGSRYATGLVADHNGDKVKAGQAMSAARELWKRADPGLPEMAVAEGKQSTAGR